MLYRVKTTLIFTRQEPANYHVSAFLDYLTTEVTPGTVSPDLNDTVLSIEQWDEKDSIIPFWRPVKVYPLPR